MNEVSHSLLDPPGGGTQRQLGAKIPPLSTWPAVRIGEDSGFLETSAPNETQTYLQLRVHLLQNTFVPSPSVYFLLGQTEILLGDFYTYLHSSFFFLSSYIHIAKLRTE